ncbi:Uncharacterised protein [Serratia liquefaciens]|nr:Uncharacterised protein [Serratia liquefaciens]CAI1167760.1 Uncharacterised protein [Serratia liquefaciens]
MCISPELLILRQDDTPTLPFLVGTKKCSQNKLEHRIQYLINLNSVEFQG